MVVLERLLGKRLFAKLEKPGKCPIYGWDQSGVVWPWCPPLSKPKMSFQKNHFTFKHGGGGVMIWGCFSATAPGHLAVSKSIINSSVCKTFVVADLKGAFSCKIIWIWIILCESTKENYVVSV